MYQTPGERAAKKLIERRIIGQEVYADRAWMQSPLEHFVPPPIKQDDKNLLNEYYDAKINMASGASLPKALGGCCQCQALDAEVRDGQVVPAGGSSLSKQRRHKNKEKKIRKKAKKSNKDSKDDDVVKEVAKEVAQRLIDTQAPSGASAGGVLAPLGGVLAPLGGAAPNEDSKKDNDKKDNNKKDNDKKKRHLSEWNIFLSEYMKKNKDVPFREAVKNASIEYKASKLERESNMGEAMKYNEAVKAFQARLGLNSYMEAKKKMAELNMYKNGIMFWNRLPGSFSDI